jgi:hypothetical protein
MKSYLRFFASSVVLATTASADVHFLVASLDGAQVIPPVITAATGWAIVTVDDVTGYVHVLGGFSDLSTPIGSAHIHGPGAPGSVLFPLVSTGANSGTLEGSATLNPVQVAGVLDGQSYVDVHSALHTTGEIRGKVLFTPVQFGGQLDGTQAGTPSTATGTYSILVDRNTNTVTIMGSYTGLMAPITAAQLHGPAWYGSSAPMMFALSTAGGSAGTYSGVAVLSQTELDDVLEGFTYVNVLTNTFPLGEIRGQIFRAIGNVYCPAEHNSTSGPGMIFAWGSPRVVDNMVLITATGLPLFSVGYLIGSQTSEQRFPVAGSRGRICVMGPNVARFVSTVQSTGFPGSFHASLDLTNIPTNPPSSVMPGDTWNFQVWYRDFDHVTGPTSNFTNAFSIDFR